MFFMLCLFCPGGKQMQVQEKNFFFISCVGSHVCLFICLRVVHMCNFSLHIIAFAYINKVLCV